MYSYGMVRANNINKDKKDLLTKCFLKRNGFGEKVGGSANSFEIFDGKV